MLLFRLVRAKKFVEQEQIQQVAMIPAKEAKLLTYRLLEENFLQLQELRKSLASNVPNKTFFLFYIDLNQVNFYICALKMLQKLKVF
jgi:DNA-directed RNA polymerase III subunit RPC3